MRGKRGRRGEREKARGDEKESRALLSPTRSYFILIVFSSPSSFSSSF